MILYQLTHDNMLQLYTRMDSAMSWLPKQSSEVAEIHQQVHSSEGWDKQTHKLREADMLIREKM